MAHCVGCLHNPSLQRFLAGVREMNKGWRGTLGSHRCLGLKEAMIIHNLEEEPQLGERSAQQAPGLPQGSPATANLRPQQGGSWGTRPPVSLFSHPLHSGFCLLWAEPTRRSEGSLSMHPKHGSLLGHRAGWRKAASGSKRANGK